MAWLQTAPQPKNKHKNLKAKEIVKPMTRLQQLEISGKSPDLPEIGAAAHLVNYLFDVGPASYGAMGPVPLGHIELAAWQSNTGISLAAWEVRGLRRLSGVWVSACRDAEEHDCPPFYVQAPENDHRQAVSNAVRNIFGSLSGSKGKAN